MKQLPPDFQKALDNLLSEQKRLTELKRLHKKSPQWPSYVITDSNNDGIYVVAVDKEGKAKTSWAYNPYLFQFSGGKAKKVVREFKAENGRGPIEWKIINFMDWVVPALIRLQSEIDIFNNLQKRRLMQHVRLVPGRKFSVSPDKAQRVNVDGVGSNLSWMNGAYAKNIRNGDGKGELLTVYDETPEGVEKLAAAICEALNSITLK